MNAARYAAIVAAALAAGTLAARALLRFAPAATANAFAQPLPVATDWNAFGALLLLALALSVAVAGWAYFRVLAALRDGDDLPLAAIAGIAALALCAAAFAPVLYSSDVYAYAAYGEMARTGIAPYSHVPLPAGNAVFDAAIWQWGNPPPLCVYGPAFVAAAAGTLALFAPLGTLAQLDGLRALACVAFLLCVLAAYAAYPGDERARRLAAATIGLNPVALWCAAEGHNDALALAVALAGFALLRRGSPALGAAVAGLSGAFKAPGLAAAIPLLFTSNRARIGALAGIAGAVALSYPLLYAAATDLAPGGHYAPQASLQAIFAFVPALAPLVAIAACAWLARAGAVRLRRGENEGWIYLALAAWVLVPNPYPWYGLWLVAAAAVAPGTRAASAALLLSLTSLLRYAPDAVAAPNEPVAVLLGLVAVAPLLSFKF